MTDLTATEVWIITTALMIIGSIGLGFGIGYIIGQIIGYNEGVQQVAEAVNNANITGDVEEAL